MKHRLKTHGNGQRNIHIKNPGARKSHPPIKRDPSKNKTVTP